MRKLSLRKNIWVLIPALLLSFFASPAQADTITTNGANDFFFSFEESSVLTVRTFAQQYGIDSMLWLYNNETNQLLTANDDYFGLDSYISYPVQASVTYRLRTGVCCGDPERWYGGSYAIETNSTPINTPQTSTTTTTTTVAPYINPPTGLVVTSVNENKVYLDWQPPAQSGTDIERYAIFFSNDNWQSGWAVSSLVTNTVVENLEPDTEYKFKVRADNDTLSVYSGWSEEVSVSTNPLPTTTTTSTTTTSTTTTTTVPPTTTTQVPVTTTTTVQESFFPLVSSTTSPPTITTTLPPATTTSVPTTTTTTTLAPPPVITVPVTNITEASAIVNNIEESSKEEITSAVVSLISNGISKDDAKILSSNPKVLESISEDQAKEIFKTIEVSELSASEEAQLVEALTSAPDAIKNQFENEIDIFGEGLDDYVPTGSNLDVGTRRSFLAATTVLSASISLAGGTAGSSSSPSGGSGTSNGGNGSNTQPFKKEEDTDAEEEDEPVEIEGPEGGDEEGSYTRNSIFKYEEGTMRKFSPWGFIKKFSRETAAMAFTISGSVIVFATLSGDTRKITLIATGCAFLVHYINVMLKNDE